MDARVEPKSMIKSKNLPKGKEPQKIKLTNAALEEDNDEIVLRGVVDPASLVFLKADDYQREVLRPVLEKPSKLKEAIVAGKRVPDVELGMRGEKFTSRGNVFYLEDEVYIIDGLQRISTVRDWNEAFPDNPTKTKIGATVRFGTNKEFEKELFEIFNTHRTPMSPNVLLKNAKDTSEAVLTLFGLCHVDPQFPLFGRVTWKQNVNKGELITATILARTAIALFRRDTGQRKSMVPGGGGGSKPASMVATLESCVARVGLPAFREGLKIFFETVDKCFNLRSIKNRKDSVVAKGNFLTTLATIMASHEEFWHGDRLSIDAAMRTRIKGFPIDSYEIIRLCGAGNAATPLLYRHMLDHLNRKRADKYKLKPRKEDEEE